MRWSVTVRNKRTHELLADNEKKSNWWSDDDESLRKKPVSTMLATSKNVQPPGHNHRLTTSADDPSL